MAIVVIENIKPNENRIRVRSIDSEITLITHCLFGQQLLRGWCSCVDICAKQELLFALCDCAISFFDLAFRTANNAAIVVACPRNSNRNSSTSEQNRLRQGHAQKKKILEKSLACKTSTPGVDFQIVPVK